MPSDSAHGRPQVIHHMGALDAPGAEGRPPNSLEAIRACLDAGAAVVEIDATALAEADYLLVHDPVLESETDGRGRVGECTLAHAKPLRIIHRGRATGLPVPRLSEVVALFRAHGGRTRLQVDYKNVRPFPEDEPLRRLAAILEPLGERVIVSSVGDWQLRRLRKIAPWLEVGFDIQAHLDYPGPTSASRPPRAGAQRWWPPYRLGAYGYWDDAPTAAEQIWPGAEYLADRCAMLARVVPGATTFYLNHQLLARSLDDGFSWAEALHREGIRLAAWTIDAGTAAAERNLPRLVEAGIDQVTTNTPLAVAKLIAGAST